jgi:hypothetical protein
VDPDADADRGSRIEIALKPEDFFETRCGAFDLLRVERCRLDELPPPNWNVGKGRRGTRAAPPRD